MQMMNSLKQEICFCYVCGQYLSAQGTSSDLRV